MWALRAQTDKIEYAQEMRRLLEQTPNLHIREGALPPPLPLPCLSSLIPSVTVYRNIDKYLPYLCSSRMHLIYVLSPCVRALQGFRGVETVPKNCSVRAKGEELAVPCVPTGMVWTPWLQAWL